MVDWRMHFVWLFVLSRRIETTQSRFGWLAACAGGLDLPSKMSMSIIDCWLSGTECICNYFGSFFAVERKWLDSRILLLLVDITMLPIDAERCWTWYADPFQILWLIVDCWGLLLALPPSHYININTSKYTDMRDIMRIFFASLLPISALLLRDRSQFAMFLWSSGGNTSRVNIVNGYYTRVRCAIRCEFPPLTCLFDPLVVISRWKRNYTTITTARRVGEIGLLAAERAAGRILEWFKWKVEALDNVAVHDIMMCRAAWRPMPCGL